MKARRLLGIFCTTALTLTSACGDDSQGSGTESGSETATDATGETGGTAAATTSGSTGADTAGADFDPVLLDCPNPASLPFATQASSFESAEATDVVANFPRNKDEASDLLGNPEGNVGYTTMGNDEQTSPNLQIFTGRKARTAPDQGLVQEYIPAGEWVSLWGYDGTEWTELARTMTNMTGGYQFDGVPLTSNRLQPHYAILEGDQSCAAHYQFLLPAQTPIIVTDIDGTLTLSDEEFLTQIDDGSYDPVQMGAASELINAWADKGYPIVYLTARPHPFRSETRQWLDAHGFPAGPVISSGTLVVGSTAQEYKRTWVERLTSDFDWDVVAAYGNADSDIGAYAEGGIPTEITFIVGEFAGDSGTQPIENLDYTAHIAEFVEPYPDAPPID